MLGFVQSWIGPRANPIGIDLGSDCIRMAQVQWSRDCYRLIAAASIEAAHHDPADEKAHQKLITGALRDLPRRSEFRSHDAVLALPASMTTIREFMFDAQASTDDINTRLLPDAIRSTIDFDFQEAVVRSIVVDHSAVATTGFNGRRVIAQIAQRSKVLELIRLVESVGLKLVGMTLQSQAIVDCFAHVFRRQSDADTTTCFIDIGWLGTRAVISRGQQILAACDLPIGGEAFCRSSGDNESTLVVKRRRILESVRDSAATRELMQSVVTQPAVTIEASDDCQARIKPLATELRQFCRDHDSRYPESCIDRLLFIGGEARQRTLCNGIAQAIGVPIAQLGDPLVRLGRSSDIGVESGIDRREPQPAWAIAMGLTLGPALPPVQRAERNLARENRTALVLGH